MQFLLPSLRPVSSCFQRIRIEMPLSLVRLKFEDKYFKPCILWRVLPLIPQVPLVLFHQPVTM